MNNAKDIDIDIDVYIYIYIQIYNLEQCTNDDNN